MMIKFVVPRESVSSIEMKWAVNRYSDCNDEFGFVPV